MTTENQNKTLAFPAFPACTPADELEFAERALRETLAEGSEDDESLRKYCAFVGFLGCYFASYEDVLEFNRNANIMDKTSLLLNAATYTVFDLRMKIDELEKKLEASTKRGELEES